MTSSIFVVTGTSRGLGLELTRQLSAKGHTVFACARNPDASEKLQELVNSKQVIPIKLDTLDRESIKVRSFYPFITACACKLTYESYNHRLL